MNEISKLVKNYSSLINDLNLLNEDINKIITCKNINATKGYWAPRDRNGWTVKKTFSSIYKNYEDKYVFYVGFNLDDDHPYLLLEKIFNLINCTPDDFNVEDCFLYVDDPGHKEEDCVHHAIWSWGQGIYVKIDLITITSQEIVENEIKPTIDYLLHNNIFSLKHLKQLKLLP